MSYKILYSDIFRREAKTLSKKYPSFKQDLTKLISELTEKSDAGISLGHNMFKVRMSISSKGRGKSGGARVITILIHKREEVLLADVYDKSDYDSVDEQTLLKNLRSEGFDV